MAVDREGVRKKVRRKLARAHPPYLPMLHPVGDEERITRLSCAEWEEYRQRRRLHLSGAEDYLQEFRRPTVTTARTVWNLLESSDQERFDGTTWFPAYGWLEPETEQSELRDVAKQAFLIVIDTFINAGRSRWFVTLNDVFDALARGFSDNFLGSRAAALRDMTVQRAMRCRQTLWGFVTGPWSYKNGRNPLFYHQAQPFGGYQVLLRESRELAKYEEAVKDEECL
jgi:hypothetical protein